MIKKIRIYGMAVIALSLHSLAWAADEKVSPGLGSSLWALFIENAFGLTIFFILASAIIGAIVKNRKRDGVLKSFDGYPVVVTLEDGRRIWGELKVYPSGMEISYKKPVDDPSGHQEASFFLHQNEYSAIRSIHRPLGDLSTKLNNRRKRDLEKYIRPSIQRKLSRFFVIQFSILRDAIIQAFSLFVGQAKTRMDGGSFGSVLQTQDKHITELGKTMIGSVNLAHDPIFESLFGQGCITEIKEGSGWREIVGTLREYSSDWLFLLQAGWPQKIELKIDSPEEIITGDAIEVVYENKHLIIRNTSNSLVEVVDINCHETAINMKTKDILPNQKLTIPLSWQGGTLFITFYHLKPGDLILPRSKAIIRHRAPKTKKSLLEQIGFK